MRNCEKCGVEMIKANLHGEPFDIDIDKEIDDFSIRYTNGTKEVKGIFGNVIEKENYCESKLNVAVCPRCGKVELYIDVK